MDIEIDGLEVFRGNKIILNNIYLKISSSKVTGIFGRNGSGKTTLFDVISGLIRPNIISLRINGKYVKNLKKYGLLSYLSQESCFPGSTRVSEMEFLFGLGTLKMQEIYSQGKIDSRKKFSELSSGQRRFLEVLLFVNSHHQFTILDEPFTGLMPIQIDYITAEISRIKSKKGVIISDHQLKNHLEILDACYLIKDRTSYSLQMESLVDQLEDFLYIPRSRTS